MWHHISIRGIAYRREVTANTNEAWVQFLSDAMKAALQVINTRRPPNEQVTESELMQESMGGGRRGDSNDPGDSYIKI